MKVSRFLFSALMLLALNAGAQTSAQPTQETKSMNSTTTETYRPHTLAEYPELTPEEIGRRMLKLIDSLKNFDELSLEHIRRVTGLPMDYSTELTSHGFGMYLPASDWHYNVSYYDNPRSPELKNVVYRFVNRDERADMGPVCALDFNAYEAVLRHMGFEVEPSQYDDLGRLRARYYSRGNVKVQIIERGEAGDQTKIRHACVESIGVSRGREQ